MVSLIDENIGRRRKRSNKRLYVLAARERACGIVWIADVDQSHRIVGTHQHCVQIMRVVPGQRNATTSAPPRCAKPPIRSHVGVATMSFFRQPTKASTAMRMISVDPHPRTT